MSNTSHSSRTHARNFIAFFISGVVVAGAIWILFNRQYALDVATNWTYDSTTSIDSIVERTELTEKGKFVFFATRPEVLEQQQFNQTCPRQEAGSPILGCYTTQDRIYMYNVSDEKLDGMKEVTAAHEVLHAVWQRTSAEERERIGALLKTAYATLDDTALKTRIEYYERTEPGELVNELHSILGTEVPDLTPELENYYSQFFNRTKVLALHDSYSKLYNELTQRADTLFAAMEAMGGSIKTSTDNYTTSLAEYSTDVDAFNARADSLSDAQFNRERSSLMSRAAELERQRQTVNDLVATYNGYYDEYQKNAAQLKILNDGMDSYSSIEETPPM